MSLQYGLLGKSLLHSFSQKYFSQKFLREELLASYSNFELEHIEILPEFIKQHADIVGLNVTIPYKQSVIPFLDELDIVAKKLGAVNCIKIENGKLTGYNTDVIGFEKTLHPLLNASHTKALILGTGGASLAVKFVLEKLNIDALFVSRSNKNNAIRYEDLNKETLHDHTLIINTTPVGTFPDENSCPIIPYQYISHDHLLYDLIYNPSETKFLKLGKQQGATVKNGLEMLEVQAEESWKIWKSTNRIISAGS